MNLLFAISLMPLRNRNRRKLRQSLHHFRLLFSVIFSLLLLFRLLNYYDNKADYRFNSDFVSFHHLLCVIIPAVLLLFESKLSVVELDSSDSFQIFSLEVPLITLPYRLLYLSLFFFPSHYSSYLLPIFILLSSFLLSKTATHYFAIPSLLPLIILLSLFLFLFLIFLFILIFSFLCSKSDRIYPSFTFICQSFSSFSCSKWDQNRARIHLFFLIFLCLKLEIQPDQRRRSTLFEHYILLCLFKTAYFSCSFSLNSSSIWSIISATLVFLLLHFYNITILFPYWDFSFSFKLLWQNFLQREKVERVVFWAWVKSIWFRTKKIEDVE